MNTTCGAPGCEELARQRCSSCKAIHYCSRACQRQHWIMEHKDACAYMAARRSAEISLPMVHTSEGYHPGFGSSTRPSIGIVTIFDSVVTPTTMPADQLPTATMNGGWHICPVAHMLGMPLAIKQVAACNCRVCLGPGSSVPEPTNQVVTRLAIDPATGMAPQPWQGGSSNHLGTVAVARTDLEDFSGEDWAILDDYIYNIIFDVWGLDPPDRDRLMESMVSRQSYAQYVEGRHAERYVHF